MGHVRVTLRLSNPDRPDLSEIVSAVTPVLVTDTLDLVLVGVITLEALSLVVDPTTGELRESEAYLL
jgi:predicted aspartyl protease